jgi:hypothetical protein
MRLPKVLMLVLSIWMTTFSVTSSPADELQDPHSMTLKELRAGSVSFVAQGSLHLRNTCYCT